MSLHAIAVDWRATPIKEWSIKTVQGNVEIGRAHAHGSEVVVEMDGANLGMWPSLHAALRGMEDRMQARCVN